MKCEKRSQQTPVKPSLGIISLASPPKLAGNIRIPQVTPPAFTWEQGQLARATGSHKYRSHVILGAHFNFHIKYSLRYWNDFWGQGLTHGAAQQGHHAIDDSASKKLLMDFLWSCEEMQQQLWWTAAHRPLLTCSVANWQVDNYSMQLRSPILSSHEQSQNCYIYLAWWQVVSHTQPCIQNISKLYFGLATFYCQLGHCEY